MSKKPITTDGLINTAAAPTDTGIPQRGNEEGFTTPRAIRAANEERRSDMLSFKVKSSVRDRIRQLAKETDTQIAVILEEAFEMYEKKVRLKK